MVELKVDKKKLITIARYYALIILLLATMCAPSVMAQTRASSEASKLIKSITVVDSSTNKDLQVLSSAGNHIHSVKTSSGLNIRADAASEVTEVVFQLNSVERYRHEWTRPFALAGDEEGNYNDWKPRRIENKIIVTPYIKGKAQESVTFKIAFNRKTPSTKKAKAEKVKSQRPSKRMVQKTRSDSKHRTLPKRLTRADLTQKTSHESQNVVNSNQSSSHNIAGESSKETMLSLSQAPQDPTTVATEEQNLILDDELKARLNISTLKKEDAGTPLEVAKEEVRELVAKANKNSIYNRKPNKLVFSLEPVLKKDMPIVFAKSLKCIGLADSRIKELSVGCATANPSQLSAAIFNSSNIELSRCRFEPESDMIIMNCPLINGASVLVEKGMLRMKIYSGRKERLVAQGRLH